MIQSISKSTDASNDHGSDFVFDSQIPEYCRNFEEQDIVDQAFPLIFAFDEIVALGYRESVNLAQIRTFTEMESHEEAVFKSVREVSRKSLVRICLFDSL
jgi:hypothetical protein